MNEQNQFVFFKGSEREWELNSNLIFCVPTYILKPWFLKALRSRNSIVQGEVRHWDIAVRALAVPTENVVDFGAEIRSEQRQEIHQRRMQAISIFLSSSSIRKLKKK